MAMWYPVAPGSLFSTSELLMQNMPSRLAKFKLSEIVMVIVMVLSSEYQSNPFF